MKRKCDIVFVNDKLEKEFEELQDKELKKYLIKAFLEIQKNVFCGIRIPKKLIPKEYILKYKINNLMKYDLPNSWRLIYSITTPNKVEILAVILEWFDHKKYERRFRY